MKVLFDSTEMEQMEQQPSIVDRIISAIDPIKQYDRRHFTDVKRVGCGRFSTVFRVNYKNEINFALKSFYECDEATIDATVRELKMHKEVDFSDNIIRVHGITHYTETIFNPIQKYSLVLEYADGGTLGDYLKSHHLKWDDKYRLALQLSNAVTCLHGEGIVHRDLHSGNVLIRQNNIKLSDFGLSKRINEGKTFLSKNYGVVPYVDPKGNTYDDEESRKLYDVFSLGVLLWEISSGRRPFENINYDQYLMIRIAQGERETIVPDTPTDYYKLYTACWDGDPSKRPAASQVAMKLKEIIEIISKSKPISIDDNDTVNNQLARKFSSSIQLSESQLYQIFTNNDRKDNNSDTSMAQKTSTSQITDNSFESDIINGIPPY